MLRETWQNGDRTFLALCAGLTLFGLVMLTSASGPDGLAKFGDTYYFLKHQLIFGLLPGLLGMGLAMAIPYGTYRRFAGPMLFISLALLTLVFIPGIGADFGTFAHTWIALGNFSMQPSEIVKLTFLMYLAAWMEKRSVHELRDFSSGVAPFFIVLSVIILLLILQPDTGTMGIIVAMALAVYFVAGAPIKYLTIFGGLGVGLVALLLTITPYRAERFTTFLHPEQDPQGKGYHINQALLAVGSGGFFGRGYGHSLQKFQYLPEVSGDSIFAVVAEELGFLFTTGFLVLYVMMLSWGFAIAGNACDPFGKYLVTGIIAWLGTQALMNIAAMVALLPITGVPLPLVSYGGTAFAVALTAIGIVMNVSAHGVRK